MKSRLLICFFCCILSGFLTACNKENISDCVTSQQSRDDYTSSYEEHIVSSVNGDYLQIIEESNYFKIYQGDDYLYYYDLYDTDHKIVKTDCTFVKPVDISMLTDNVVAISLQTGTGIESRWTYYYDAEIVRFSDVFYSVLDAKSSMVVFATDKALTIQDIFDKEMYSKQVEFSDQLAQTESPFVSVKFANDMKNLIVQYESAGELKTVSIGI